MDTIPVGLEEELVSKHIEPGVGTYPYFLRQVSAVGSLLYIR